MILVDPSRVIIGSGLIAFVMFVVGFWLGHKWGFSQGLITWRKSYNYTMSDDIKEHIEIIRAMSDKT